jgi:uncharacterized beta-barrel protein YwiB (DUF1934 family)
VSKKPVTISLSSVQADDDLREVTEKTHAGTLYERDGAAYLLYDDDGTSTTLRLTPDEIRLYRRGEVSSWQVFQLGEMTGGLLSLGPSEMILRVMTSHFHLAHSPQNGRIELHYELFTAETAAADADPTRVSLGKFSLSLDWRERASQ